MKRSLAGFGLSLVVATSAAAGGFTDEIIEPIEVIEVAEAQGSLPGWVIPTAIFVAMVALASSGSDDGGGGQSETVTGLN